MAVFLFLVYFYTVLVIEIKRNLAPRVHEIRHFDPKISKKNSMRWSWGARSSPKTRAKSRRRRGQGGGLWRGTPSSHLTPLAHSAPPLGSGLRRSTFPQLQLLNPAYGWPYISVCHLLATGHWCCGVISSDCSRSMCRERNSALLTCKKCIFSRHTSWIASSWSV